MTIRPTAKKPTVRDVAAAAEVSVATVSRVLAGAPKAVTDSTQRRVLDAAARLGYEVNVAAKSLATGRHGNVAVLVPDLGNQHFTSVVQSVIHASNDVGMHVFVGDSLNSPELEVALATEMLLRSDGLIMCSPRSSDEGVRAILDTGKPIVTVNRRFKSSGRTASVQTDAVDATTQIVDSLLDLGHRSFAFVVAQSGSQQVSMRWEVVHNRTAAAGGTAVHIALPEPLGEVTPEVRAAVDRGCTALICANDVTAAAVIYAVSEMGLRVPGDVSVTGFDDTPLARWVTPRLTTARMHEEQLGRAAWEAMTQLLLPNPVRADRIFHADVVFRDSAGPAPRH
ncbi:LacI family DNA-binding transcriptional regulator [Mycobacterium yunnanensis]|uniref:LacI family DNA-binding transcriptional regulator n=1 Tax=Mycobacterium yunnanensis TaxID=368477 RepID=A0A9X3C3S4_9MYCO|nr:LacI family DNA-binding transcriptional regulator [Mycobacterium yunnanensis]MCV7423486.1 LacI family DNA-binding transcriptional regulator [Mycobacterium yunnanensis]